MHLTKLFRMPCIGYVYITQRKDPKEELLCALLGASRWHLAMAPPDTFDLPLANQYIVTCHLLGLPPSMALILSSGVHRVLAMGPERGGIQ
jgi:hypothetical protein